MPNTDALLDARMRADAFQHIRGLQQRNAHLTNEDLKQGFAFEGKRFPLVNPQRGIFKPRQMAYLLSIRTVFPRPGGKVWYDDQRDIHRSVFEADETVQYAFMGTNPEAADNRWLREAFESKVPVIYFLGIAPGLYQAVLPAFIAGWNPKALKASVAFGVAREESEIDQGTVTNDAIAPYPEDPRDRHYALRVQKVRLHQASFREAILSAYQGRCAVSGLPEPRLLDAAHIIADKDERFGQPVVPNGIPLSKIHHAAFDAHLIGIDADYRLHVADRLLEKEDGPLLESLKVLKNSTIHLPQREVDRPDRERLDLRFEQFRAAV